jgi:hypothetical protein
MPYYFINVKLNKDKLLISSNILPRCGLGGQALPGRKIAPLGKEFLGMGAVQP